jgi:rubredoxin
MQNFTKEAFMDKWQCTRCDYIYDPDEGDSDNDIETGTSFEDLPKKWVCPECGANKNKFKPYSKEEDYESDKDEE